jgi:hypothetical protein
MRGFGRGDALRVVPRTIQSKGVKLRNLVYRADVLTELAKMKSPCEGKFKDRWPIHVDPDDISRTCRHVLGVDMPVGIWMNRDEDIVDPPGPTDFNIYTCASRR